MTLGHWNNLDEGNLWDLCKHTNLLIQELDTKVLWDNFGIVSDIVVCYTFIPSPHLSISPMLT